MTGINGIDSYLTLGRPTHKTVDPQILQLLAKSAAAKFVANPSIGLNSALIEKLAEHKNNLTYEHYKRACEIANVETTTLLNAKAPNNSSKVYPTFELATPDKVASVVVKIPTPIQVEPELADYRQMPKIASAKVDISELFKAPSSIHGKTRKELGNPLVDAEQIEKSKDKHLTEVFPAAKEELSKVAELKMDIESALLTLERKENFLGYKAIEAAENFSNLVKQAQASGTSTIDITDSCMKIASRAYYPNYGRAILTAVLGELGEVTKIAAPSGIIPNEEHPVIKGFSAYLGILIESEKLASERKNLERDLERLSGYVYELKKVTGK